MRIILAALMVSFLMSCKTLQKTDGIPTETHEIEAKYNTIYREVPVVNYSKYNSRDNVGEFLDDARFRAEQFFDSIEYCETNILDILFYPITKPEQRQGRPLIYR